MADGDREYIGGWLVVEDHRFGWNQGMSDPSVKIAGTGELGHARWNLFIVAWREACRRDLDTLLQGMADRVGIEYSPAQRRRTAAPHNAHTTEATS